MSLYPGCSPVPEVRPASLSFTASAQSASDLSTYTFASLSLGAAAAGRKIIVAVSGTQTVARTISSVTVAGVAASVVATVNGGNTYGVSLWVADVPAGSSGDVVVTWSGGMLSCGVGVWAAYDLLSAAAYDSATDNTYAYSASLDIPGGGFAIAYVHHFTNPTSSFSWSGLTERFDAVTDGAIFGSHSGASAAFSAPSPGATISVTPSGGSGIGAMVVASFR